MHSVARQIPACDSHTSKKKKHLAEENTKLLSVRAENLPSFLYFLFEVPEIKFVALKIPPEVIKQTNNYLGDL